MTSGMLGPYGHRMMTEDVLESTDAPTAAPERFVEWAASLGAEMEAHARPHDVKGTFVE